jgi:eukaryotic-like serine/threonine-protein kinase
MGDSGEAKDKGPSKPTDKLAGIPVGKPAPKPVEKAAGKPAPKPVEKAAEKPAPNLGEKLEGKAAAKPAAKALTAKQAALVEMTLAAAREAADGPSAAVEPVPRPGRVDKPKAAKRSPTPVPREPLPLAEGEYPLALESEPPPPPESDAPTTAEAAPPSKGAAREEHEGAAAPVSEERAQPDSEPPPSRAPVVPVASAAPGRTVGRCELFAEIAHGGMATIHLGRWLGAGGFAKPVAVKALHSQYARDPEFVRMFMDEARVVAGIRHPNVMPTIDLVEEDGELFIVMDYIEGVTLSHLMRKAWESRERIPVAIVLRVVAGVLHGLHAAHEAKNARGEPMCVIHRDVSPENIMVGVDGYPRLIDFGIATALDRYSKTRDGELKGKLAYLAPEQVLGAPLSRRTDVFAASIVLWQALTGRKLFAARNVVEAAHKVLNMELLAPSAVSSRVPKALDRIVMRGLERDPAKRWPTAEHMAEAIEAMGRLATYSEVGSWVRHAARERLAQNASAVEAMSSVPSKADGEQLSRPLSVAPAERADLGEELAQKIGRFVGRSEFELKTDTTNMAAERPVIPAPPRTALSKLVKLGLVGAGAVTLLVVGLWVGMGLKGGGSTPASSPGRAAASSASPRSGAELAVPSHPSTFPAASAEPSASATPSGEPLDAGGEVTPADAGGPSGPPDAGRLWGPIPGGGKVPVAPKGTGTIRKPFIPPDI